MKVPKALTRVKGGLWHPSAYVLEYFRPNYPCTQEQRLGMWSDRGGWICQPYTLNPLSVVYTFGSEGKMTFEVELYRKLQPEIHLLNPGVPEIFHEKLATREEFRFHPVGLSDVDRPPEFLTLKSLMKEYDHTYIDLLKVDCGGCEYKAFANILKEELVPIGQIIVDVYQISETARLKFLLRLFERRGFRLFHMEQDWRFLDTLSLSYIHESQTKVMPKGMEAVKVTVG